MTNLSPWIHALTPLREPQKLTFDTSIDVAIIGGGIAGISTAFFLLTETDKKILLLEAGKVAHGATGHNAGQIVSYFERPFADIVRTFGLNLAAKAQAGIYEAWDLLFHMYRTANVQTTLSTFTGYAGCTSVAQVVRYLEDVFLQHKAGLAIEEVLISEDIRYEIPNQYGGLYAVISPSRIKEILETNADGFVAALASKKGCTNSAQFSEQVAHYLLQTYPDRFSIYEHSPVDHVILEHGRAKALVGPSIVTASEVVLCTNGFERIRLTNTTGKDVDTVFHRMVKGKIGYMAGYLEPAGRAPTGISYLTGEEGANTAADETPYFYLTRRSHDADPAREHTLVCVGGPEDDVPEQGYTQDVHPYPERATAEIDTFLKTYYRSAPEPVPYAYTWHGLMGYTSTGLRCIGREPENPVLLYNLGCNGIGILPSVYGGKRIAQAVRHRILDESIFDPKWFRT